MRPRTPAGSGEPTDQPLRGCDPGVLRHADHHSRRERTPVSHSGTRLVLALSIVAALLLTGAAQATARAGTSTTSGRTQVVTVTQDVPALVVENLCNADTVNLHGS